MITGSNRLESSGREKETWAEKKSLHAYNVVTIEWHQNNSFIEGRRVCYMMYSCKCKLWWMAK